MLDKLLDAIASSVPDTGAPGGILYAALMQSGFSLLDFQRCMFLLVAQGRLYKRGEVYFPVPSVKEELERM